MRFLSGAGERKQKAAYRGRLSVLQLIQLVARANNGGWQRPTLPRRYQRSTIGARELNCRVRDGTGWTLTALATNTPLRFAFASLKLSALSGQRSA